MIEIVSICHPVYYATSRSAGFDICSNSYVHLLPGERTCVPTGMFITNPKANIIERLLSRWFVWELQIRPRSGLAAKYGITVLNSPGTVDADYPQEILIILHNTSNKEFSCGVGERIAQGVIALVFRARGVLIKQTERTGGGGSTGK